MNKIRVIDLLNKIANGEEVPKKIKHGATVFILDYFSTENKETQYISENYKKVLLEGLSTTMCLNDEVEIIEEEKEIEKLNLDTDELKGKETVRSIDYLLEGKINELIDVLNSIKKECYDFEYSDRYIEQLQQANKKYKEVIDKLKKCINDFPAIHYSSIEKVNKKRLSGKLIPVDELLEILKDSYVNE